MAPQSSPVFLPTHPERAPVKPLPVGIRLKVVLLHLLPRLPCDLALQRRQHALQLSALLARLQHQLQPCKRAGMAAWDTTCQAQNTWLGELTA